MLFDDQTQMKKEGFSGFVSVAELQASNCSQVPEEPGVYFVLSEDENPSFRPESIGGHYKGNNPTVSIIELETNWVHQVNVVYIAKAGTATGKRTLKLRIDELVRYGSGECIAHWGGRFLWQLENSANLIVAWKTTTGKDAGIVKKNLIRSFKEHYGKRPFANLQD